MQPKPKHSFQISLTLLIAAVLGGIMPSPGSLPLSHPEGPRISLPTAHASQGALSLKQETPATPLSSQAPSPPPTSSPLPDYPHPQYQYHIMVTPSGPLVQGQPFLTRIAAAAAWSQVPSSSSPPVIAVIDTGFALAHESLSSRWLGTPGTPSWRGWDFAHNDDDPRAGSTNPNGAGVYHGTMTAGLASVLNPDAKIMPLQALEDDGTGYTDEIAAAIRYAVDNGANIISLSLGTDSDDTYLHAQIRYALRHGVLVVAAAGNDGCNCLSYPANYPEVLAVGAGTAGDNRASFSSYGENLDLIAPGTAGDVCSASFSAANPTTAYSCARSGTSFSTPIVSGLAALVLQRSPGALPGDIIKALELGADKPVGMGGQFTTPQYGYGRVNAAATLTRLGIGDAFGQLVNKGSLSLSEVALVSGPQMTSTCVAIEGATCSLTLSGPGGASVDLGQSAIGANGGAIFEWSASTLNLTPGLWQVVATITSDGLSLALPAQSFSVNP